MIDIKKCPPNEIWVTKFNEEASQEFRCNILAKAKSSSKEPILVFIDSYGGEVDSLAKMIETMDEVPNPIVTVCVGKAMSCGAILLSHGDLRYCGRHSRIMIHEMSAGAAGDVHDIHADAVEAKRLNEYFLGLLAKNCGFKNGYRALRSVIKHKDGRDIYLNATNAVKFGIVDKIGIPNVKNITLYDIATSPLKDESLKQKVRNKKGKKNK